MNAFAWSAIALIAVGSYGIVAKVNVLKIVTGIVMLCLGVAGLVVGAGSFSTPVPQVFQAVGLLAMVGGASVVSLLVVTAVRLYQKYGTLDIREMRRLKG